mmetsp:Transcript_17351/g.29691  ORF Transcript_17351/g.29691 Transcript_17351/m.29691 type:complete len:201 (-) Transcript_17351:593-1195(-)
MSFAKRMCKVKAKGVQMRKKQGNSRQLKCRFKRGRLNDSSKRGLTHMHTWHPRRRKNNGNHSKSEMKGMCMRGYWIACVKPMRANSPTCPLLVKHTSTHLLPVRWGCPKAVPLLTCQGGRALRLSVLVAVWRQMGYLLLGKVLSLQAKRPPCPRLVPSQRRHAQRSTGACAPCSCGIQWQAWRMYVNGFLTQRPMQLLVS